MANDKPGDGGEMSKYRLCLGLLVASLLAELALMAQVPAPLQSGALSRVLFIAAVVLGIALLSNIARYVGAAFLAASAFYTIYGFGTASTMDNFPALVTIDAVTGLELISAYLLGLSGSFSKEFKEKRANAPAVVARARLSILILLAVCVIALTAHDIYRLAQEP
jgi:hypothetical protein